MELTARQSAILDYALDAIGTYGMSGLTVRNLSRGMGFSEAALYRHFPSKAAIISGLIGRFDAGLSLPDGLQGWAMVEAFAKCRLNQVVERPSLSKTLFSEEIFQSDPAFSGAMLEMRRRHRELLIRAFREAIEQGELRSDISAEDMFLVVIGAIRLLVKQWGMSDQSFDLKSRGQAVLSSLSTMLSCHST